MALALGGAGLLQQQRSISVLAVDSARLRERVEAVELGGPTNGAGESERRGERRKTGTPVGALLADPRRPLDWQAIGAKLVEIEEGGGSPFDERLHTRLGEQLGRMSRDELAAVLDEIATGGLPLSSRKAIFGELFEPLMAADPEWTLTRYIGEGLSSPSESASAFGIWAAMDPERGVAWLDARIAEGMFDGKSPDLAGPLRLEFEGKLIGQFFSEQPELAMARLEALPESQRGELLRQVNSSEIEESGQRGFVELLRRYLPADDVAREIIRHRQFPIRIEGADGEISFLDAETSGYLDRVGALPKERETVVMELATRDINAATVPTPGLLTKLRSWIDTQAPGKSAGVTGAALAGAISDEFTFEKASVLVADYDVATGTQDGLVAFLKQLGASESKEKAMPLIDQITDEATRREILDLYQPEEE